MISAAGLRLENLALKKGGTSLSLEVPAGQCIAVVGAPGSGKSLLLRTIAGLVRPALGSLNTQGIVHLADERLIPKRGRIDGLARPKGGSASLATDALVTTGLWNVRAKSIAEATPGQLAGVCLLPTFTQSFDVLLIDSLVDLLDVGTRQRCLHSLRKMRESTGAVHLISTHQIDIVEQCDGVIVMKECDFRASSSVEALKNRTIPDELIVETTRSHAIRAMIEPFAIKATEVEGGLKVEAFDGQELAQKLLVMGYGDVKCVFIRQPSLSEVLLNLI